MDSGANGHFYQHTAKQTQALPTHRQITAMQLDVSTLASTSEAKVALNLPLTITMSLVKLCDAGCTCTLNTSNAIISYQGNTIMEDTRKANGLWYLITNKTPSGNDHHIPMCYQTNEQGNSITSVYQTKRIKEAMQFLHAALWSPAKSTLLQTIKAGFFAS